MTLTVNRRALGQDALRRNTYRKPGPLVPGQHQRPDKGETVCAVESQCMGCPLINRSYPSQIDVKRQDFAARLQEAGLRGDLKLGHFEESSPKLAYRHTVKLAVAVDGGGPAHDRRGPRSGVGERWVRIGLFRPGTRDVTDIGWCSVQDPRINAVLRTLRHALKNSPVPVHGEWGDARGAVGLRRSDAGKGLRYVVVRRSYSTGNLHLTFVTSLSMRARLMIVAREIRQRHPELHGVTVHLNQTSGNAYLDLADDGSAVTELLIGEEALPDCIAGVLVAWAPLAFAQANPAVAERMVRRIWELADVRPLETWLDVYCGVGVIGLGAAPKATRVVGIEENAAAIAQARRNAVMNGVNNWSGFVGRAEDLLTSSRKGQPSLLGSLPLGVVTMNPSRRGCQPEVLKVIASQRPRQIIYMSCDASTLLRDLKVLESLGYATRLVENYDMFPGTMHYETLAVLTPV